MRSILIFTAVFSGVVSSTQAKLPGYLKPCNHSSPDLTECLQNSIVFAVEQLKGGKPELGIPPLEPYVLENITHSFEVFTVRVNFTVKQLTVSNLTNIVVHNATVTDGHKYNVDIEFPVLKVNGRFLFSFHIGPRKYDNVAGTGKGILEHLRIHLQLEGIPIKVNNKDSVKFDKLKVKLSVGKSNVIAKIKGHESIEKFLNRGLKTASMKNSVLFKTMLNDLEDIIETELLKITQVMTFGLDKNELFLY